LGKGVRESGSQGVWELGTGDGELTAGAVEDDFGGLRDFPAVLGDCYGFGIVVAEVDVDGGVGVGAGGETDADDATARVAVGAGAERGENFVEGAGVEGLAVVAVEAVAEPVVEDGVREGESLVDAGERDEGLTESGGEGGVLGEFHEQVGDGGAMLGCGGGFTCHSAPIFARGCSGGRVDSLYVTEKKANRVCRFL
jgi:hypothetical protein